MKSLQKITLEHSKHENSNSNATFHLYYLKKKKNSQKKNIGRNHGLDLPTL